MAYYIYTKQRTFTLLTVRHRSERDVASPLLPLHKSTARHCTLYRARLFHLLLVHDLCCPPPSSSQSLFACSPGKSITRPAHLAFYPCMRPRQEVRYIPVPAPDSREKRSTNPLLPPSLSAHPWHNGTPYLLTPSSRATLFVGSYTRLAFPLSLSCCCALSLGYPCRKRVWRSSLTRRRIDKTRTDGSIGQQQCSP